MSNAIQVVGEKIANFNMNGNVSIDSLKFENHVACTYQVGKFNVN